MIRIPTFLLCLVFSLQVQAAGQPKGTKAPAKAPAKAAAKRALPKLKEPPLLLTARYTMRIHNKIQRKWKLTGIPWVQIHRRSATLRLWIKTDGRLRRIKIVSGSGLAKFDRALTKAVAAALPFPKPSPALRKWVQTYGVEILFRRRVLKRKALPINKTYKGSMVMYDWQKRKLKGKARPKPRK